MTLSDDSIEQKKPKRKMHPNSLKNLKPVKWKPGQSGNPKGQSITARQEAMLNEMCPYFPDKTWREALADAGMRQALTIPVALSNFQDRHEGKVTQPIGGDETKPIYIINVPSERGKKDIERVMEGEGT